MDTNKIIKYSSFIITSILILTLLLLYFYNDDFQSNLNIFINALIDGNKDKVSEVVKGFGWYGILALIVLMVLQMFLIIFPSWLPMIVASLAYGFLPGIIISSIGVFLASTLGYAIGRSISDNALKKFISDKTFKKLDFWVSNYGFISVALFRISPFLSNDGISVIAGGVKMQYFKFITATMTGIIPLAIAISYFSSNTQQLKIGLYIIGGIGIVLYGIFIYFDYKKRKKAIN